MTVRSKLEKQKEKLDLYVLSLNHALFLSHLLSLQFYCKEGAPTL